MPGARTRTLLSCAVIAAAAVSPPASGEPPPRADLSTAEHALRSYWARKDWYERALEQSLRDIGRQLPPQDASFAAVMTGEALAFSTSDFWRCRESAFERRIESMAPGSGSRRIVVARIRNISPIPPGARASAREVQAREAGEKFLYVLEKQGPEWRIAEAVWDALAAPLKKTVPYPASVRGERWLAFRCRDDDMGAPITAAGSPRLDLSTPQSALQSYWAQFDWLQQLEAKAIGAVMRKLLDEAYGEVATGDVLEYYRDVVLQPERFERHIETLSPEGGARVAAVVRIRNVTPIPAGVQPSARQVEARKQGAMFRYYLQREGDHWKVASIWRARANGEWFNVTQQRPPAYPSEVPSF